MADHIVNLQNTLSELDKEAYRTLRTNIQFLTLNKEIKHICITSCNAGEGKTTVAMNLGFLFASSDKKVLFIDADMRKPRQFKTIEYLYTYGLSSYLSGMAEFDQIVCNTSIDNFSIIFSGPQPPNPAELLGMGKFMELMDMAKKLYDIVIIDTPPLGSVVDAAIISSVTDGTILIIQPNKIKMEKAARVKEQLEKANARILGVVLNKIKKKDSKDFNTYYHYYNRG